MQIRRLSGYRGEVDVSKEVTQLASLPSTLLTRMCAIYLHYCPSAEPATNNHPPVASFYCTACQSTFTLSFLFVKFHTNHKINIFCVQSVNFTVSTRRELINVRLVDNKLNKRETFSYYYYYYYYNERTNSSKLESEALV